MQKSRPFGPPAPSDNGSRKCKLPYQNSVTSGWNGLKFKYVVGLVEGSLSLEPQTPKTPTFGFMPKVNKHNPNFRKSFLGLQWMQGAETWRDDR